MTAAKQDIIQQLKQDILVMQGFKTPVVTTAIDLNLGPIVNAFPNASFPLAAVHEFISTKQEDAAATSGFISGMLAALMQAGKVCVWVSTARTLFPPAMTMFGVQPDQFIFIDLQREKDALWAMEEALKCEGLAAVVGEIPGISFTASRRLQLAVEKTGVTGFLLRNHPRNLNTIACVSRWKITSLPSKLENNMPGVGLPRWNVELSKIRNGKPGSWQIEWTEGRFQSIYKPILSIVHGQKRKTG